MVPYAGKYVARIGDDRYEIALRGGSIELNGHALTLSYEPLSGPAYSLLVGCRSYAVVVEEAEGGRIAVTIDGRTYTVEVKDARALLLEEYGAAPATGPVASTLVAPMPGLVLSVDVTEGDAVEPGQGLLVLEAMKMENELRASVRGVVQSVHVAPGDAVRKHALLLEFAQ